MRLKKPQSLFAAKSARTLRKNSGIARFSGKPLQYATRRRI